MLIFKNKFKEVTHFLLIAVSIFPATIAAQIASPTKPSSVSSNSVVFVIIQNIIGWILAAAGILGVVGLAIAVILWLAAAGELDRISKAKDILVRSLIGIVISIVGLVILGFIQMYIK